MESLSAMTDSDAIIRDAGTNKPRFKVDWTLNPSHIIAFMGLIAACATFIYGLRDDISKVSNRLEATVSELSNANKMQDNQIQQLKDAGVVARTEEIQFRSEMRNSNVELTKILTDLRISNAEQRGSGNALGNSGTRR